MTDTRQEAEAEAREAFHQSNLRPHLERIRDAGIKRLADELERRIENEKWSGPPRDTFSGDPIDRPAPEGVAVLAAACLLLLQPSFEPR